MPNRTIAPQGTRLAIEPASYILAISFGGVAGLVIVGMIAEWVFKLDYFYASPFVALVAVIANRVCIKAGVIAAALSSIAHLFFFVPEKWAFEIPPTAQLVSYVSMFAIAVIVARREPIPPPPPATLDLSNLPFTSVRKDKDKGAGLHKTANCYWSVEPTGQWVKDIKIGEEYARVYVHRVASKARAPLAAWIIRDMIVAGNFSGVEAGFVQGLTRMAQPKSHAEIDANFSG